MVVESRLAFAVHTKSCVPRRVFPPRPAVLVFTSEDILSSTGDRLGPAPRRSPHPGHPSPALQPPPLGPAPPPSGTRRGHGAVAGPRPSRERRLAALGIGMIREVRKNEGRKKEQREPRRERGVASPQLPPRSFRAAGRAPLAAPLLRMRGGSRRTAGGAGQTRQAQRPARVGTNRRFD